MSTNLSLTSGSQDSEYVAYMRQHFSLTLQPSGWQYEGAGREDLADKLSSPSVCLAVLQQLKSALGCDRVCILTTTPVAFVCNSKPPRSVRASLDAKGVADLITTIVGAKKQDIRNYKGTVLLDLP